MLVTGRATVRSAELSFERGGTGTSLLWGHGLTSSMQLDSEFAPIDWIRVRSRADVVRYDARGHGDSTTTEELLGYGWDELALDQLALAESLGIDRYVAAGRSMGTSTALHAAITAPERIIGLVLVIPPTGWETRAAQRDLYLRRADLIESRDLDSVIAAARSVPAPDPFGAEWHDRFERNLRSADLPRRAHILRGAATADMPPPDAIANIAVPTTILAWSGDPGHPVSSAERLAELIDGARLVVARSRDDLDVWTDEIMMLLERVN
ncbi:MAG: alpha/beta fold hydrolase [Ilumatobacteraceae bacterium]